MSQSRWKPIRRGAIYCSPWCGANCKYAQYKEAVSAGRLVAKIMGKGWKVIVHENLYWYWQAVSPCRRLKISGSTSYGKTSYYCYLNRPGEPGGRWSESGSTPKSAMRNTITKARREIVLLSEIVEGL